MAADAESAYGKPWFQRNTLHSEAQSALDATSFPQQVPSDSHHSSQTPPESRNLNPSVGNARPGAPLPQHGAAAAVWTTQDAAGRLFAALPTLAASARLQMQQALGDQITPLRLASHLSVLLVAGAVILFSRMQIPEWDFQLVAMPAAATPSAQFQSVTNRVNEIFNTQQSSGAEFSEALQPQIVPFTIIPERTRREIQVYTVQAGDTVLAIANRFKLNPETIQWSNSKIDSNPDLLSIGDQLKLLPVDGVLHTVRAGDTLSALAEKYKVSTEEIIAYESNNLQDVNAPLIIGSDIVVPGGTKLAPETQVAAGGWTSTASAPDDAPVGSGNFAWPASGSISQGYWGGHRAIDIAGRIGAAVSAADGGFVTTAGGGWNGGYGNYVVIDHGNGFSTLYGHLTNIYVNAGETVSAGQQIGTMGNTGNSTFSAASCKCLLES
jgi:murein DD-endopeptidase MepM/ murein hydrolase activator NlpD